MREHAYLDIQHRSLIVSYCANYICPKDHIKNKNLSPLLAEHPTGTAIAKMSYFFQGNTVSILSKTAKFII